MQSVLRSRFLFADIAFFKIEFSYSFNVKLRGGAPLRVPLE
jgi:hypothetical protein